MAFCADLPLCLTRFANGYLPTPSPPNTKTVPDCVPKVDVCVEVPISDFPILAPEPSASIGNDDGIGLSHQLQWTR